MAGGNIGLYDLGYRSSVLVGSSLQHQLGDCWGLNTYELYSLIFIATASYTSTVPVGNHFDQDVIPRLNENPSQPACSDCWLRQQPWGSVDFAWMLQRLRVGSVRIQRWSQTCKVHPSILPLSQNKAKVRLN